MNELHATNVTWRLHSSDCRKRVFSKVNSVRARKSRSSRQSGGLLNSIRVR